MMTWFLLAVGLVLLVVGADLLVNGAARLAAKFGVHARIIALAVAVFVPCAPELAVSVKAAYSGQAELAIANAVGSNIFNTLFILGAAALITPLIISKQLIRQDVPIMIGVSVLAVVLTLDGDIVTWEASLLVACLVGYTGFLMYQGKKQNNNIAEGEVAELLEVDRKSVV